MITFWSLWTVTKDLHLKICLILKNERIKKGVSTKLGTAGVDQVSINLRIFLTCGDIWLNSAFLTLKFNNVVFIMNYNKYSFLKLYIMVFPV